MNNVIAMIPARLASSRYPNKPLIDICGKSMIEHVWQRVKLNDKIDRLFIATCDEEIRAASIKFGAEVIMTSKKHVRCTDRIGEACNKLLSNNIDFDIVINIQGDEPLFNPKTIDLILESFNNDKNTNCVNLIEELNDEEEILDRNNVKAIFDKKYFALYFSRLPIPTDKIAKHYKQLGAYGLKKKTILQYMKMEQTPLEIAESDDMLRFIENGIQIKVAISPYMTIGVDTPDDHKKVNKIMANDEIYSLYKEL